MKYSNVFILIFFFSFYSYVFFLTLFFSCLLYWCFTPPASLQVAAGLRHTVVCTAECFYSSPALMFLFLCFFSFPLYFPFFILFIFYSFVFIPMFHSPCPPHRSRRGYGTQWCARPQARSSRGGTAAAGSWGTWRGTAVCGGCRAVLGPWSVWRPL